jgi:hypothetical protein
MPTFRHTSSGKRFFFAHIPRTAGRFVEANLLYIKKNDILWDEEENKKWNTGLGVMTSVHGLELAHFHREYYEKFLNVEDIPHVSIVRNPIDRFISASIYLTRCYGDDIQEAMEDPMMFSSMLFNFPLSESLNWYRPMVDFMSEKTNIWKFEDGFGETFVSWLSGIIELDLEFRDEIEYPTHTDEHNKLERTPKLIHNLKQLYRKDIEQFYPELAT